MNYIKNHTTIFQHLGLIDYEEAWNYQEKLFSEIINIKVKNRSRPTEYHEKTPNYLLFCEHPHVYTLGKSGDLNNLLLREHDLNKKNAAFYRINRGGDITYHGPGQLVGYPLLDLDNFFTDIHKYLRCLEEAVIRTILEYDLNAGRIEGLTGVWLDYDNKINSRKICAIGVKSSRWVTMHGFAFNINTDLSYFNHIIPCGIKDRAVTSLSEETGRAIDMREVEQKLKSHLIELFDMELIEKEIIT